jgi:D-beta-D-heptose 7-phosphate kinase/D-beta-D-heptose 1-phosphate adenosyltransferase
MTDKLKQIVRKFRGCRLGVVGDLMLDRYVWGNANRLSPEAAVPIVDFAQETSVLGGAGNVAANLAALGARVSMFSVAGDDAYAQELRSCLRAAGIAEKAVLTDSSRQTTVKTRIIARHQQLVRVDRETREPLTAELQGQLARRVAAALPSLDALVISDYDKGVIPHDEEGLAARILAAAHKAKVPVFVKPKTSRLLAYRGARAIVCNRKEAGFFATRTLEDDAAVEQAGRDLLARFGCSAMIITLGEKGMRVYEDESKDSFYVPATGYEVTYARVGLPGHDARATGRQVFDVTGAGDTVVAALALAVAAGANMRDAALLANAAAGVVVSKLGTATVSPQELLAASFGSEK